MKLLAVLAFGLTALSPARAEPLSVAEVLAIRDNAQSGAFSARAEWQALSFYLQGVVEGAVGYQQALVEQGKRPLFCPPKGGSHSLQEIFSLLSAGPAADKRRPAHLVILEAYARKYPCKE